MKTRFLIDFTGYHENGSRTNKKQTILNIEGDITIDIIKKHLSNCKELSQYRRNKEIEIHSIQVF